MKNFAYYRPKSAKEAVALLDDKWGTSELLAGGTDLLDLQKEYIAQPDKVVSVRDIAHFTEGPEIYPGGTMKFAAGVRLKTLALSMEVNHTFPALATAAGDIGGPQIRNMGT
ncbi:MAG: FAD binding domain-containing protein, partial [Gemmataceae bacterium]